MTDYKTAYETLAAAVWGAIAHLRNPGMYLKRWEIATALEDTLERALAQVPAAAEGTRPWQPEMRCVAGGEWLGPYGECTTEHAPVPFHKDGAYVRVELTESGAAAVENIRAGRSAAPQGPCPSCGSVDWSYGEGQHCDDCPSTAAAESSSQRIVEPPPVDPDPDAAEREHCERVVVVDLLGWDPNLQKTTTLINILLRERADAAKRATEAERARRHARFWAESENVT